MLEDQRKLHRAIHHWLTKIGKFFDRWRGYTKASKGAKRPDDAEIDVRERAASVQSVKEERDSASADNSWLPVYVLALLGLHDMAGVQPLEDAAMLHRMADSLRHMGCVVGAQLLEPLFALAAPQAVNALREGHATDFFPATGAVVKVEDALFAAPLTCSLTCGVRSVTGPSSPEPGGACERVDPRALLHRKGAP